MAGGVSAGRADGDMTDLEQSAISRQSIQPTYDRLKTGDRFTLEIRENDRRLSLATIPDPFHNTTIRPRGWRVALAVLLRRYKVTVIVGGDPEIVEDVTELDSDYLGRFGSSRRQEWDAQMNQSLGDFAARIGEHTDD